MNLDDFKQLYNDAVPINPSDLGSKRQIEAEDKFFDAVRSALSEKDYERVTSIINNGHLNIDEALLFSLNSVAFGLQFAYKQLDSQLRS